MDLTYKKLEKAFEKEVKELQKNCPHKKTKWFDNMYAPGHFNGTVLVCLRCNKRLKHYTFLDEFVKTPAGQKFKKQGAALLKKVIADGKRKKSRK